MGWIVASVVTGIAWLCWTELRRTDARLKQATLERAEADGRAGQADALALHLEFQLMADARQMASDLSVKAAQKATIEALQAEWHAATKQAAELAKQVSDLRALKFRQVPADEWADRIVFGVTRH